MSGTFQSFEQDFSRSLNSLQRKLSSFPTQTKDLKEVALNEGFRELSDAEKCLRQMEIELTMMKQSDRLHLQSQVRKYKEDLERIRREFRSEEATYADSKNKETLMGARLENGVSTEHRERLLNTNNLLAGQTDKLEQSKKVALECEGVAIDTMKNLQMQRETLNRALQNNREVGDNLSKGNRLIKTMARRAVTNKIMLIAVGVILLAIIAAIIYFKVA